MKPLFAIVVILLLSASSYAQAPAAARRVQRPGVAGYIRDARNRPIRGAKIFLYGADSSIIASGFSDSTGRYETNSAAPGKYAVKVVYASYKAVTITGTPVKSGLTNLSLRADPPEADTAFDYAVFVPMRQGKGTAGRKKP